MKKITLILAILISLTGFSQNQNSTLNRGLIFHAGLDEWNYQNGAELVTNGGFDTDSWWTKQTNVTIADGVCHFTATPTTEGVYKTPVLTSGKRYTFSFTVLNYSSGGVRIGDAHTGITRSANGTYTETFTASGGGATYVTLAAVGTTTLDIDNVSVREVNTYVLDKVTKAKGTVTDVIPVVGKGGEGSTRAYSFNGTSDYVSLPTIPAFGTGDFSVVIKVKIASLTTGRTLLWGLDGAFGMYVRPTGKFLVSKLNEGELDDSNITLLINTDYTIGYTRTGTVGTYYVNGIADRTVTDNLNYTLPTSFIGALNLGYNIIFFSGSISMCRIFNYALTPTQVINYSKPEYPIEWVDRGATGTNLITNGAFESDVSNWTNNGACSTFERNTSTPISGTGDFHVVAAVSAYRGGVSNVWAAVSAKRYLIQHTYRKAVGILYLNVTKTASITGADLGGTARQDYTATSNTTVNYLITPTESSNAYLAFGNNNIANEFYLDNISVKQLGCILDLNAEGATSSYWYDKTNSLTATPISTSMYKKPVSSNLGASYFNGTTGKVTFANILGTKTVFSISVWVNTLIGGGHQPIFCEGMAGAGGIMLGVVTTIPSLYIPNSAYELIGSSTAVTLNTWNHIACTYDGTTAKMWLNGVLVASGALTKVTGSSDFVIGNWPGVAAGNNIIYDLRIYDRILGINEIINISQGVK